MGGDAAECGKAGGVILHFAYGSNMSPTVMRKHAPWPEPIGVATLTNYRFLIIAQGYASVAPLRAKTVYGVLWRLTPRDCVTLAAWENIASGLYRAETLPVRQEGRRRMALVYRRAVTPGSRAAGRLHGSCDRGGAGVAVAGRLH